jgi:hypothetical protein
MELSRNSIVETQNNENRQPSEQITNINIRTSVSTIEAQMVIASGGTLCSNIFQIGYLKYEA